MGCCAKAAPYGAGRRGRMPRLREMTLARHDQVWRNSGEFEVFGDLSSKQTRQSLEGQRIPRPSLGTRSDAPAVRIGIRAKFKIMELSRRASPPNSCSSLLTLLE